MATKVMNKGSVSTSGLPGTRKGTNKLTKAGVIAWIQKGVRLVKLNKR